MTKAIAVLEMAGNTYDGEGETIFDALKAIPLEYTQIKAKGTLKVSKDGKSFERLFTLLPLRRFFANKIYKEHWAHQVEQFLK